MTPRTVTDPAKIRPGWLLRIPDTAHALDPAHHAATPGLPPDAAPAPPKTLGDATTPAEPPVSAEASGPPASSAPSPSPAAEHGIDPAAKSAASAVSVHVAHESEEWDGHLTHIGLGLSAVAAAAVVGAVGRRRVLQQRHRRPRRRIAMPGEELHGAELELRVAENSEIVRLLERSRESLSAERD